MTLRRSTTAAPTTKLRRRSEKPRATPGSLGRRSCKGKSAGSRDKRPIQADMCYYKETSHAERRSPRRDHSINGPRKTAKRHPATKQAQPANNTETFARP